MGNFNALIAEIDRRRHNRLFSALSGSFGPCSLPSFWPQLAFRPERDVSSLDEVAPADDQPIPHPFEPLD